MSGNSSIASISPISSPAMNHLTPLQQGSLRKTYNTSNSSFCASQSSKIKKRFVPDTFYLDRLVGLKFFTIRNQFGCYVVPSEENVIAGYSFPKLKVDEQANRILLPIFQTSMVRDICQRFGHSPTDFVLSISLFRTRAHPVLALTVKAIHKRAHFHVSLGNDVYPETLVENGSFLLTQLSRSESCESPDQYRKSLSSLPSGGRSTIKVPRLDFFLCSEDMEYLLNEKNVDLLNFFATDSLQLLLQTSSQLTDVRVARRTDGVLGNTLMKRYSTIKHMNVEFVFNTSQHFLEELSWSILEETALRIHQYGYLNPTSNTIEVTSSASTDCDTLDSAVTLPDVESNNQNEPATVTVASSLVVETLNEMWPNDVVFDVDQSTVLYAKVVNSK
jgi:hypothetical protein